MIIMDHLLIRTSISIETLMLWDTEVRLHKIPLVEENKIAEIILLPAEDNQPLIREETLKAETQKAEAHKEEILKVAQPMVDNLPTAIPAEVAQPIVKTVQNLLQEPEIMHPMVHELLPKTPIHHHQTIEPTPRSHLQGQPPQKRDRKLTKKLG